MGQISNRSQLLPLGRSPATRCGTSWGHRGDHCCEVALVALLLHLLVLHCHGHCWMVSFTASNRSLWKESKLRYHKNGLAIGRERDVLFSSTRILSPHGNDAHEVTQVDARSAMRDKYNGQTHDGNTCV